MGLYNKLKGKAKEAEGRVTGDKVRQGQGKVEATKGDLEMKGNKVARKVRGAASRAKASVKRAGTKIKSKARGAKRA
jgi:uncharacterized protein YjbJ (UPF0337 family)